MSEIKVMNNDEIRDFCIRKDYEIFKKDKEIERLNNIINEAIEYLDNTPRIINSIHYRDKESNYAFVDFKVKGELLNILKGSGKE